MRLTEVVEKVFGTSPSLRVEAAVRRLSFEGLTFSLQDMKARSDPDLTVSRPMPLGEREDKRAAQVKRLLGVLIEGELDPSNALVDKAAMMMRDGVVRFFPPSACTSRDAEIASTKRSKEFLSIEGGELSLRKQESSSSLFSQRLGPGPRRLLDWQVHEKLARHFFNVVSRPAPPGIHEASVAYCQSRQRVVTILSRRPTAPALWTSWSKEKHTDHMVTLLPAPGWSPNKDKGKGKGARNEVKGVGKPARTVRGPLAAEEMRVVAVRAAARAPGPPASKPPPMPKELASAAVMWNLEEGCSLPTSGSPPECARLPRLHGVRVS